MLGDASTAAVLLEAIQVSALDFIAGIGIALVLGTIALIVSGIRELEKGNALEEPEPEVVDPWATLPPKWNPPRAESDLGDVSDRRAA